jgi:acetyltransferase-like isoleucine patch superfamily enzyme
MLNSIGENFSCDPSTRVLLPKFFKAGNHVFIGEQSYISAQINIADNVMFGPRVMILGGNHNFAVLGKWPRFLKQDPNRTIEPILIEEDVWIGACSTLIGPLIVGKGAVIGANSLVTKAIAPYTINVGSPALPIKLIFSDADLHNHLTILGYDENVSKQVIINRKDLIKGKDLPVVNKTDEYWEFDVQN